MSIGNQILVLFKKDFKVELRRKEGLTLGVGLALIQSALVALAFENLFLSNAIKESLLPALFWIIFIFSATVVTARSYEYEYDYSALHALLAQKVAVEAIYLSKLLSLFISSLIIYFTTYLALIIFLGLSFPKLSIEFCTVTLITLLGFSALAGICEPLTRKSALKSLLYPLVFLPLMFPLFLLAIELTIQILNANSFTWNSPVVSLLVIGSLLYSLLGLILVKYILYE